MSDTTTPELDFDALVDALHQAIEQANAPAALAALKAADADDDTARLIDRLSADDRQALFGLLTPAQGAEVLGNVYYFQGADIIEDLTAEVAAPFIAELDSDDRADPMKVRPYDTVAELEHIFEDHHYLGLPVVNKDGQLIGIIDRESTTEALQEAATEDLLKFQGLMGKEELRSMPLKVRSGRRLSWLSINIVLNLISASIIAMHQDTLQAVIALAVFLPIISDMSGCSGNQAVAVSMRELSLDLVSPKEFVRVFIKESSVGLINGACLGLLVGCLCLPYLV